MSLLLTPQGQLALQLAAAQPDPDSLAAAQALRRQVSPDLAAAALTQASLRRRAVTKFGTMADQLFLTRDGLEQATRPRVSQWRAQRLLELGITRVVDLGCGIGADARAFAGAGLEVVAVEKDEATAEFAALNLAPYPQADVVVGDILELVDPASPASQGTALFLDPARRTAAGRSWNVADFTPPWGFVEAILQRPGQVVVVKLGPGIPDRLLPADAEVSFVADDGDLVEASLWHGPGLAAGRQAVLLTEGGEQVLASSRGRLPSERLPAEQGRIGRFVIEPESAVIRAGAQVALAAGRPWWAPFPEVAYLSCDQPPEGAGFAAFEVDEVLPWSQKGLRQWCHRHEIGTIEIKKRGIELDPAALRKQLKLSGSASATVIITPTVRGAAALIVRRVGQGRDEGPGRG